MRKFAKIISIALILVSLLGVCSGCMRSEVMTTLYFGVPFEKDSEHWNALQLAVEDINMFKEDYYVRVELVEIPSDEEGKKEFLKDMDAGRIAFFMYDRDEHLDKYLKSGRIATLTEIQQVYPACYETAKQYMLDTSTDSNGVNHMLALAGTYQGVFFNEKIFLDNGLLIPKTWEQFNTSIETLKAAGITPIAGGFADTGMRYWMDELILMEGGVAEHSYVPKYGVVNSWARAMDDFKALYNNGTFNKDCMDKTHEQAVEMFNKGEAAMILCNSKDVITEDTDVDNTGVFSLPVSTTGKKNIGDIICDFNRGVYVNTTFLKKKTDIIDTMIEMVVDYLNSHLEDYGDEDSELVEWSYLAYSEPYMCPADPYTVGIEELITDEYGDIIEDTSDPTIPDEIKEETSLQKYVFDFLENVDDAGRSLVTNFDNIDYFVDQVKEYTLKGGDREEILLDITENVNTSTEEKTEE